MSAGLVAYYNSVTDGSYTFKNNPTAASSNIITSVVTQPSTTTQVYAVSGNYVTGSGGGSNPALSVILDASTIIGQGRIQAILDGNYSFGFGGSIAAALVTVPGDNASHTIALCGAQFGSGSGFTVTTSYATIVAIQVQ